MFFMFIVAPYFICIYMLVKGINNQGLWFAGVKGRLGSTHEINTHTNIQKHPIKVKLHLKHATNVHSKPDTNTTDHPTFRSYDDKNVNWSLDVKKLNTSYSLLTLHISVSYMSKCLHHHGFCRLSRHYMTVVCLNIKTNCRDPLRQMRHHELQGMSAYDDAIMQKSSCEKYRKHQNDPHWCTERRHSSVP